jgi:cadmium resistance protein CadD (predicted permease)
VIGELVHPRAVAVGAGVALAICVPAAILAQILDEAGSVDDDSSWLLVLFGVILVGMGVGGFVAADRRLDAPLTNGAVAALAAYLLVQTIGAIRLLASGDDVTWVAIPFFALLSGAAGMTGGLVADHRARRPR